MIIITAYGYTKASRWCCTLLWVNAFFNTFSAARLGVYKMATRANTASIRVKLLRGGQGIGALRVQGISVLPHVPTAAAIANVVADTVGVRIETLPMTAGQVLGPSLWQGKRPWNRVLRPGEPWPQKAPWTLGVSQRWSPAP